MSRADASAARRELGWGEYEPVDASRLAPVEERRDEERARREQQRARRAEQRARRTVVIRGHGAAAVALPSTGGHSRATAAGRTRSTDGAGRRRRPSRSAAERLGSRPDRVALWGFLMALSLVLAAAVSAHAATRLGDRTLKRGMDGRDVRQLQVELRRLGFFSAPATAHFGTLTRRALVRYQRSRCLAADGIAGPTTLRALRDTAPRCSGSRPKSTPSTSDTKPSSGGGSKAAPTAGGTRTSAYLPVELGTRTLRRGLAGRDVRVLQRLLGVDPTGTFGPLTEAAVRRLQRAAGLEADGRVGPATRNALAERRMRERTVTWYGPGLYGNRTACGQTLTRGLVGVAHRTLPCGRMVTLEHRGRFVSVPVVDRGPYVRGVTFDLTAGAARRIGVDSTARIRARY